MGKGEGTLQVFYEKLSCLSVFLYLWVFCVWTFVAFVDAKEVNIASASLYLQPVLIFILWVYLCIYVGFPGDLEQKREAPPGEKPEPVRTHLRNMIIVPEMIGSIIGVYNGKTFNQVEIKPEMISHYLAEFSISYKPVKHGRPGIGATHSSRFIPLK